MSESSTWSIVVLPDTQIYARSYPEIFEAQTRWIVDHAEERNIQFVIHEGDIVDDNSIAQWTVAKRALGMLDDRVPYILALGNHDYGTNGRADNRNTLLHDFFAPDLYKTRKSFGGMFEEGRLDNSYHIFDTPGGRWLVVALEFGPRDGVVEWARTIVKKYRDIPAIVVTHAYLYWDDTRYDYVHRPYARFDPHSYGVASLDGGVNDGQELWDKLVRDEDSIDLVLAGHTLDDGLGRLSSVQRGGSMVHQVLANYQMKKDGGEGYLRILEFRGEDSEVKVFTYSPWLDEYKTDPDNEFYFDLEH